MCSSGQPFRVNIGSLAAVGFGNTLRTAGTKRSAQVFRGGVGSFASLAFKPLQGRIVRITATERTLDDNAVADSMLGDKFSLHWTVRSITVGTWSGCFTGLE